MMTKTEETVQNNKSIRLKVNGKKHRLEIGDNPGQIESSTPWHLFYGNSWDIKALKSHVTTAHAAAARCCWMGKQRFHA